MVDSPFVAISRVICLTLFAGTAWVIHWAVSQNEFAGLDAHQSLNPERALRSSPRPPEIPEYATIAELVDQRLRGPLYDPPPPPPKVTPPPEPIRVDIRLVGTVLEPGRDQALFARSDGKILFCDVGETIPYEPGKILLESVTESDAVLLVREPREEMVTLSIEQEGRE